MCRLVAYLGAPVTAAHLVFDGGHSLFEQSWAPKELLSGSVNADGYGIVWYAEPGSDSGASLAGRLAEMRPIWFDHDLQRTLATIRTRCALAALRNSTPGIPVDRSGLLPLLFEGWSFVLNGFVPDFRAGHMRALRAELPDDLYAELHGSSDSETLFLMTVAAVREGATLREALERTARTVIERVGRSTEAQLNMVVSDGSRVAAVRTGTQLMTNSLYVAKRPPFAPDGVVLASERLDPGAVWEPVDGHSWIEIGPDFEVTSEVL